MTEKPDNPDRRNQEEQERWLHAVVDDAIRHNIGLQALKKNGSTLTEWLSRNITLDRILWVILMIFLAGGRFQQTTADLAEFAKRTELMRKQHEDIHNRLQNIEAWQELNATTNYDRAVAVEETKDLSAVSVKQTSEMSARLRAQDRKIDRLIEAMNTYLLRQQH